MHNNQIAILDYGVGNLESIGQALKSLGQSTVVTHNANEVFAAAKLILPGVGSFPAAMKKLQSRNLLDVIKQFVKSGKPILGICLGMQLLMEYGEEFTETPGLGLVKGRVVSLKKHHFEGEYRRIPNVGWYQVLPKIHGDSKPEYIVKSIDHSDYFYFTHSFVCQPTQNVNIVSTSQFGSINFCSILRSENIYGVQFHPEKSGNSGIRFLRNFVTL
jgi:glutamine amidotransferase